VKNFIRPAARDDILRQYRYYLIEENSPIAAERFLKAVKTAIVQVCKRPGLGVPITLSNPRLAGLRSWPVAGFPVIRVYYLVSENLVRVVRVLHGKRDISTVLENEPPDDPLS
jgi:toxin ParE1/3/4